MDQQSNFQGTRPTHRHAEAYLLMRYEGTGGRREWIWNSRDAVTPMFVPSIDGTTELHHGNWHLDRYDPLHVPAVGSRVFIDLTEEIARPFAIQKVEGAWSRPDYPMSEHPQFAALGREGSVEYFVKEWVSAWDGHSPHCAVVTQAMQAIFKARAEAGHV